MNLLSDKIAITYCSLNSEPPLDAAWNRYTTVNNFAFIGDAKLLCISISPNLFINCMNMVFLDPETGEELEVLPYMDMTEAEFFQYTTIYDFGACDFDDITFTKKHICALQGMTDNFLKKVSDQMAKWKDDLNANLAHEISHNIDKDLRAAIGIQHALSTPSTPNIISSMMTDTQMTQIMSESCMSVNATNQGNP